jgi:hypothetical protein
MGRQTPRISWLLSFCQNIGESNLLVAKSGTDALIFSFVKAAFVILFSTPWPD